jgi:hypothetical protein
MKIIGLLYCLLLLSSSSLTAQVKNIHRFSNKIPEQLVTQKIIGADTITSIEEKYFKEGWNVFQIGVEKFMYIDFKNNVVRGFLLSDTTGTVKASAFFRDDNPVPAWCTISLCSCKGEKECADMFAGGECKYNKVCVGNTCFCTKPYEIPNSKMRIENN